MFFKKNDYVKGIVISVWTIVQTVFHVIWTVTGYSFYWCKIKPTNYLVLLVHLTYFYNYSCGDIYIENTIDIFSLKNIKWKVLTLDSNLTHEDDNVYNIVYTILEKGAFPKESTEARRTQMYIFIYMISDGIWIVTALLLFGLYFEVKKCSSIIFYGPWLVLNTFMNLLDVVSAVHFGLDMLQTKDYTSWLKFMGIQNYNDFMQFNEFESSKYIPRSSTVLMVTLFSRVLVVWVLNVICLFHVSNIAAIAFQGDLAVEKRNRRIDKVKRRKPRNDLDSFEERIRNWQLFYGAVGTSRSTTSDISNHSSEIDQNSNSRGRNKVTVMPIAGSSHSLGSLDSSIEHSSPIKERPKTSFKGSSHFTRLSDVSGTETNNLRKDSMDSLRGHFPWSYIEPTNAEASGYYDMIAGTGSLRNREDTLNTASTAL